MRRTAHGVPSEPHAAGMAALRAVREVLCPHWFLRNLPCLLGTAALRRYARSFAHSGSFGPFVPSARPPFGRCARSLMTPRKPLPSYNLSENLSFPTREPRRPGPRQPSGLSQALGTTQPTPPRTEPASRRRHLWPSTRRGFPLQQYGRHPLQNPVGPFDRRQAMGDDDDCSSFKDPCPEHPGPIFRSACRCGGGLVRITTSLLCAIARAKVTDCPSPTERSVPRSRNRCSQPTRFTN